jgi:hypothetical protein
VAIGGFAALLHFPWEMLQAPFYSGVAAAEHWQSVLECGRATLGDAGIALAAYGLTALFRRDRLWLAHSSSGAWAVYLLAGLLLTIVLEGINVYVLHRWSYSRHMPMVFGIGLTPLLQWLVLPPLNLWLARRHLGLGTTWTRTL